MVTSLDPKPLHGAALAVGFMTWVALHKFTIPGDIAAAVYVFMFGILYTVLHNTPAFDDNALVASIYLALTYTLSACITTVAYRLSPWHPLAKFPGPPLAHATSLWLSNVTFGGRKHHVVHRLHAKYGLFVRIGPNVVSINSPSGQYIYSAAAHMSKSESYRAPGNKNQVAMFFKTPNEKIHSERKRIWSGLFTKDGYSQLLPVLEKRTYDLLRCMERRQAESKHGYIDLTECFAHWSYDFMGDMVFSGANQFELMKNGDPDNLIMGGKMATLVWECAGQSPWLMDLIWHLPVGSAVRRMRSLAAGMVQARLKAKEQTEYRDLMSYLTAENKISVEDLELDAVIGILGGSDNTASILPIAIYFLTAEPRYYQMLRDELDKAFPDPNLPFAHDVLMKLPFLEAVINETLRLGSPYFITRVVPEGGATIDDRYIPQDTIVGLAAYSQQIDPQNFSPDPLDYRPERWFPEGLGHGTKTNKNAIYSFCSGPHVCIAKAFAYQELRSVVSRLVLTMDIVQDSSFDSTGFRDGILNMRTTILEKHLLVKVKRRVGVKIEDGFP